MTGNFANRVNEIPGRSEWCSSSKNFFLNIIAWPVYIVYCKTETKSRPERFENELDTQKNGEHANPEALLVVI